MPFLDANLQLTRQTAPRWLVLKTLSCIYSTLVSGRLRVYRHRKPQRAAVKVISIGNITVGGTGKTPLVDWILAFCDRRRLHPAVITRGYKAKRESNLQILNRDSAQRGCPDRFGDEPWLLFRQHPQFTYYITPDRVRAAELASRQADLILLDDGMQHLRLHRDLDIVLIDATSGIGNGEPIPLGPLREPLKSLSRIDVVIYTRTNLVSAEPLRSKLAPFIADSVLQVDCAYVADRLEPSNESGSLPPSVISGRKCLLFSGIGNPSAFSATIRNVGGVVVDHLVFEDHQPYDTLTLSKIRRRATEIHYEYLICTEKDWVKLETAKAVLPLFHRLRMRMEPAAEFVRFLENWFDDNIPHSSIQMRSADP
jgi:tetraacyldisaccharide 4'-kinase